MERNFLDRERTPKELILFGSVAGGLLISIVGIILSSIPTALTGIALIALGLTGFAMQKEQA